MYVLGMAKSSLCLKGGKASKLEFDFFKLVFAVNNLRVSGEQVVGYLKVLSLIARERGENWVDKFLTGDAVVALYCVPDEAERGLGRLEGPQCRESVGNAICRAGRTVDGVIWSGVRGVSSAA